jgi:hypothetical protein
MQSMQWLSYVLCRIVRDISSRFFSLYITLKAHGVIHTLQYVKTYGIRDFAFQIVFKRLSTVARRKNIFFSIQQFLCAPREFSNFLF